MFPVVNTKRPEAVESEIRAIFQAMYPGENEVEVSAWFRWALTCFDGKYPGYLPIDMKYHDLEHTLQGALCLARLVHGRQIADVSPHLPASLFRLGMLAILFHDTGYLKKSDDLEGTGAKYTMIHVDRSAEFAEMFLRPQGLSPSDIAAIQHMIHCTGVSVDLASIPFQSELERMLGFAIGTSDLVSQMADAEYLKKLPVLYLEFEECRQFYKDDVPIRLKFSSARDLIGKTPWFWEKYVLPKIDHEFEGLYKFLARPPWTGPNDYIDRVEGNILKLRAQLAAAQK